LSGKLTEVCWPLPPSSANSCIHKCFCVTVPPQGTKGGCFQRTPCSLQPQDAQCWVSCANGGRRQDLQFTQTLGSSCSIIETRDYCSLPAHGQLWKHQGKPATETTLVAPAQGQASISMDLVACGLLRLMWHICWVLLCSISSVRKGHGSVPHGGGLAYVPDCMETKSTHKNKGRKAASLFHRGYKAHAMQMWHLFYYGW
jgi:hypothetical protein